FHMVTPDRGRSNTVMAKQYLPAQFSVSNVRALSDASAPNARDYAFTLTVNEHQPFALDRAVDFWSKPAPEGFRGGVVMDGNAGQRRVSEQLMQEFIKQHFSQMADLTVDKVSMKVLQEPSNKPQEGGMQSGKYQFELETKGRASTKGWPHDISLFFGAVDPQ